MNNPHTAVVQELATDISDRAFRLYCVFVLRTSGEWTTVPALAAACGLKHHQVRAPLTELHRAALIERDRVYQKAGAGRMTWRTYFRLPEDTSAATTAPTSKAAA
ncbi:hypothetical protein ACGFYQ_33660 [Streptomyces sp. NPDC048258]|uniref:hypothetical protein n=1 Tax=Streptomyces sp. NPDC048258 TaxID=3365527 RepID=UPI003711A447